MIIIWEIWFDHQKKSMKKTRKSNRGCLRNHLLWLQSVKEYRLKMDNEQINNNHFKWHANRICILHLRLFRSARQVANFRSLIATPVLLPDWRASTYLLPATTLCCQILMNCVIPFWCNLPATRTKIPGTVHIAGSDSFRSVQVMR